ncbi:hypothetical protein GYMLUDRAFT_49989 [Collybiopsis luxurians FD-317 M1]|uniref:DUF6533 domain-containing protein n=1 Tax=Collybiopsis luxurians FD-317 M1 TaxID=944289 RepID=A0A0D0C378_9AGAR|nr:hypothetical protein GYMLUDRAFT_49989 [Collybiopsis luxurians FD-317 M1]
MDGSALFDLLFEAIRNSRSAYASVIAPFTILLYDCFLTFDQEITYIWNSHWTMVKILYLFAKYYGLVHLAFTLIVSSASNPSAESCKMYLWWTTLGGPIIFTTSVNLILGLRLYALYQSSKLVLALIVFLTIGEFVAELWGSVNSVILETRVPLIDLDALELLIPDIERVFPGCAFGQLPSLHFTLASYIPNLCVSGIFFCLMAYKCFKSAPWQLWFVSWNRNADQHVNINGNSPPEYVITYFIRDGTIFFFLVFSAVLVAMLTMVLQPTLGGISIPWVVAAYSFAVNIYVVVLDSICDP